MLALHLHHGFAGRCDITTHSPTQPLEQGLWHTVKVRITFPSMASASAAYHGASDTAAAAQFLSVLALHHHHGFAGRCDITTHSPTHRLERGLWRAVKVSITFSSKASASAA